MTSEGETAAACGFTKGRREGGSVAVEAHEVGGELKFRDFMSDNRSSIGSSTSRSYTLFCTSWCSCIATTAQAQIMAALGTSLSWNRRCVADVGKRIDGFAEPGPFSRHTGARL